PFASPPVAERSSSAAGAAEGPDTPNDRQRPRSAAASGSLPSRVPLAHHARNLGRSGYLTSSARRRCPFRFWCNEPTRSARWFDWAGERFSAHSFGDRRPPPTSRSRWIPLGRLVPVPTPPPDALCPWFPCPLLWRLPCPFARPKRAPLAPCNNRF